jgi:serine phosphatase RsbU (regulator of sigma subunit)
MDIIKINKKETPAKLVRHVYDDLQSFIGGASMVNDVSLLVFRVAG